MGRPDTITKEYMRRPDVFADVFNQFLYHGKQVILPERLIELDTTEIVVPYGADNVPVPEQRYRDVAKMLAVMTDGRAAYCILAAENEDKINYAMPVKDGLYDFMQLAKQVTETARSHKESENKDRKPSKDEYLSGFWKDDRLLPVITLVIYYGADEWDGPLSLKEMYADCDENILKYAADYHINLITPSQLSDEEIDEFHTNFREVMKYIKYSKDRKKLMEVTRNDERFKNVERQAADVISVATGTKIKYAGREEKVNMCPAIEESEIVGVILFSKKRGISEAEAKQYIMEEYQKSEEEAEELIIMYWK
ncbi:MAG: Rpn family recombination-promoting nuclease/putative transposase [Lachnospiraceae bacterium]|nr:Rpn family recombination-promoting nuclease/putative transposase [Lachnospiraceae bacterium]MDE7204289.1 Rpn family recombination-promoting nuclease/putative transposase [Lachnospiraceae bacterium]